MYIFVYIYTKIIEKINKTFISIIFMITKNKNPYVLNTTVVKHAMCIKISKFVNNGFRFNR